MRNKLLLMLLIASLFVALTFTTVGLGRGQRIEGLSPDSSVSDPEGDVLELLALQPFPHPGRDLTIEGNTAKVLVPLWVLGEPQSFQWVAASLKPRQQVRLDTAPDYQILNWTRGSVSEAPDAQNLELLPYEDLTYVRLREVASSRLEFLWRCRGDMPASPVDFIYAAFLGGNLLAGPDYILMFAPSAAGWMWTVSTPGDTRFPWGSASYEDILSAAVSQAGEGKLTFEMTTAQDIPAVPREEDGYPWFSWVLDVDCDQVPGTADVNVVVRWNDESSQWEGVVRGWNGQHYVDLDMPVAFTRADSVVSATVDVADLGVLESFLWLARTTVNVGPAEEAFFGLVDHAPDSGWVEETLAPTSTATPTATLEPTPTGTATSPDVQCIYLPVITRGVMF